MDVFRIFDSLNGIDNLLFGVDAVRRAGAVAEAVSVWLSRLSEPC